MIIVRFIGGLGNQMFQYSFYKHLEALNVIVKADITDFDGYDLHNGFELENVFKITLDKASTKEISKVKDTSLDVFSRIKRKVFGQKKSHRYQSDFSLNSFDKNENLYLDGFWQASKFISSDLRKIQRDFVFKPQPTKKNAKIIDEMRKSNSVSIHVRRGDYLKLKDVYAECAKDYYQKAISFLQSNNQDCNFYVFSNDISWCKEHLDFKNSKYTFIEHNTGVQSYEDIRLMTQCKHNIIANSSFSWWGAILNQTKGKTIIYPKKWYTEVKRANDIFIPSDWVCIDN